MDWDLAKMRIRMLRNWAKGIKRNVDKEEAVGVYTYSLSFIEVLDELKKMAEKQNPKAALIFKKPMAVVTLSDVEKEELWEYFCKKLREKNIDCRKWRSYFESLIEPAMDYKSNKLLIDDEIPKIVVYEKYPQYYGSDWRTLASHLKEMGKALDWNLLNESALSLAFNLELAYEDIKEEDELGFYNQLVKLQDIINGIITHIKTYAPGVAQVIEALKKV